MEDSSDFALLSTLHLPPASRILRSSCCPDKDLVVVISRHGGKDRVSLWKMQGSKKWEVEVDCGSNVNEEVADLAWSPDCQTIVLIHDPPRITCHSIQDGHQEGVVPLVQVLDSGSRLSNVWWFTEEKKSPKSSIPDIFKRGDIVTGSTHSILKMLPLLDPVKDDTQALMANDIFAFQGGQAKASPKADMPDSITSWPTLPPDPTLASIQIPPRAGELDSQNAEQYSDLDDLGLNSILAVADSTGSIHCFLDGSYPLGVIPVYPGSATVYLHKRSGTPRLYAHQRWSQNGITTTTLLPANVDLTLLSSRIPRDVAQISSTTRQLVWYAMRVVDELRTAWMGTSSQVGARALGIRWIQSLETLQPGSFSTNKTAWSLVDLTILLVQGRSSDAISDFIGSGEQMSERGLLKWETIVVDTLIKLRDYSEHRVAPACQRIHLALEEVQGWSQLHQQYKLCDFDEKEVTECLALAGKAVIVSGWLSMAARRELSRFREFMKWLRFEISNAASAESTALPRHDVLEVHNYITRGLINSDLDRWFKGAAPTFLPQDPGLPLEQKEDLNKVMERARYALEESEGTSLRRPVKHLNVSQVDKNLHALLQDLAGRCGAIFVRAASATARSAQISPAHPPIVRSPTPAPPTAFLIRERRISVPEKAKGMTQYLATHSPGSDGRSLCIFRLRHGGPQAELRLAVLDCELNRDGGTTAIFLLDVEFFDDESLVVVYRVRNPEGQRGPTIVGTIGYADLDFGGIEDANMCSQEEVAKEAERRWKAGEVASVPMPIKRSRALSGCEDGKVTLAVNGRSGRRVACILDVDGGVLEVLDLEGDGEEEEEEEEEEAEGGRGGGGGEGGERPEEEV
ncbi:anaphase-promoting complex, cyclosome, subunit 4-domain-containing protein [Amylostereum chailletii]|nr:anaphase-promoting complex, cyclosome, subunit 4-domain-containing protein [Amylostereum chailletii]